MHCCRSYTNVKMSFIHAGVSPLTLAAMDSGFMFTYAGGSFITGQLGDRFSPVLVIGIGLLGSTFCLFLIVIGNISRTLLCLLKVLFLFISSSFFLSFFFLPNYS